MLILTLLSGCKSQCKLLCETQVRCQSKSSGEAVDPDRQIELCRTVCETMRADPKRPDGIEAVIKCGGSSCDQLASCVEKAAGVKSPSKP